MVESTSEQARVGARTTGERQPRLRLRFALYTGLVLLCTGLAISWLVNREVENRAARTVENQARAVAVTNLRSHLRASDFAAPVSPTRRQELDLLFRRSIVVPGVVGGGLVSPDGTITYSARHERIGQPVRHPKILAAVLAGKITRRVTYTNTWRGVRHLKVLQILVPVRATFTGKPIGVIGLDQDFRAVAVGTGDAHLRLALILAVALLALFITLLPIMNRLTRQLETRNRRLRELAEERGAFLEAERAARTEAEAVQQLLSEQNDRLRELDRLKDEFVSLVSHELRTPLTSIRGYIELLREDGDAVGADQRRYLEIVDRNSERLLELVSDLLFLAQIEAGKLGIERGPVELSKIVEECLEASAPVADSRGIELAAKVERVPRLQGDRARLAQVLDNLVSNGLKFTERGGRVEVRLGAHDGTALLEVEDTGVGIPADEQQHLFERFFRSSTATENAIPGTGLGLTITKAIVERHGGQIEVESAENAGTTVRVCLPLGARQEAEAPSLVA
jgi:signal transduction histidine kinase